MRKIAYILLLLPVMVAFGCSAGKARQNNFVLKVERQASKVVKSSSESIRISRFDARKPFGGKAFVYKKGGLQFEKDYYNQFLVCADEMVQEKTHDWFLKAGMFSRVARWNTIASTTYELQGRIKSLYGDFTDKKKYKAIVEVEFTIVDGSNKERVLLEKIYSAEIVFADKSAKSLVKAYGKGLEEILTELERDVAGL